MTVNKSLVNTQIHADWAMNDEWIKAEIKKEIKYFLEWNKNENTTLGSTKQKNEKKDPY